MAANKGSSSDGYRALEVLFNPWNTGHTTVNVLAVDYRGNRRITRRIGSLSLGLGRSDLVGLTASEVTWRLVSLLHEALSEERATAERVGGHPPLALAPPAPPEGVTGAAWNPLTNVALPGL